MKNILKIVMVTCVTSLFMTACSLKSVDTSDVENTQYTHFDKSITQKDLYNLIMHVGRKNGWRMTEFKEDMMIAEKTDNGDTTAVSIKFFKNYFYITPENRELHSVIEKALK